MRWVAVVLCLTVVPQIVRVIDGDTIIIRLEIPAHPSTGEVEHRPFTVRLLGVDARELRAPGGREAKAFTEAWLARGPVTVTACKYDGFGRLLGTVVRGEQDLAVELVLAGHGGLR
jgi:endonuclease YncB( thermonuclease family)